MSAPPPARDSVSPPEYTATEIDPSPPVLEEPLAEVSEPAEVSEAAEVPNVPEPPADLDAAKTTVDMHPPVAAHSDVSDEDATPLVPLPAPTGAALPEAEPPLAPYTLDDELSLRPPSSAKKWVFVVGGLAVAAVVGVIVWQQNKPPPQTANVIDKVVPPQSDPQTPQPTAETAEPTAETAEPTAETAESTVSDDPDSASAKSTENEKKSLVEILKAIEDANIPSQSRAIARMRAGAKIRKAREHHNRASIHFRKKRYDRAIRYYVKALVFVPAHEEATEGIMRSLDARGEVSKALSWAKRLVQLDSKNAMNWSEVGDLLRKLKRPEEARVMYERALEENRKNKAAIAGLKAVAAQ